METNHIQEKCFFLCSWQRFNPDSQLYTPFENRFMRAEEKKKKKATTCLALACVAVSFFVTMFSFIFITKKLKKKQSKKQKYQIQCWFLTRLTWKKYWGFTILWAERRREYIFHSFRTVEFGTFLLSFFSSSSLFHLVFLLRALQPITRLFNFATCW